MISKHLSSNWCFWFASNIFWIFLEVDGAVKNFVLTFPSLALSSTPYVFVKVLCLLVKDWRAYVIKIVSFLHDSLSIAYDWNDALIIWEIVKKKFFKSSFCSQRYKINLDLVPLLHLVIYWNRHRSSVLKTIFSRIPSIMNKIKIKVNEIYIFNWEWSEPFETNFSIKFIIFNMTHLRTRFWYSWHSIFKLCTHQQTINGLIFWKNNMKDLNTRATKKYILRLLFSRF